MKNAIKIDMKNVTRIVTKNDTKMDMRNALKLDIKSAVEKVPHVPMFLVHQQPNILNDTGEDGLFPIRGRSSLLKSILRFK